MCVAYRTVMVFNALISCHGIIFTGKVLANLERLPKYFDRKKCLDLWYIEFAFSSFLKSSGGHLCCFRVSVKTHVVAW